MKNLFDLTGKKAVVVGGGGGIGQAIAGGLAFAGADVVIASRKMETLEAAAAAIKEETGKDVACLTVDVLDPASIQNLADESVKLMGTVDILVNSQGLNKKIPSLEITAEDWDAMFDINVRGTMLACQAFGKIMVEKGYGKIINVSSIRGIRALNSPGNTCYSCTKSSVDMLTKSLSAEWAKSNVHVNAIGPVVTETPMMISIFEQNPALKAAVLSNIPMGRIGLTSDNIGPAIFLASEASDFLTGHVIYPDGGCAAII